MNVSAFPAQVKIVEVGPRDGLQNESTIVSTNDKFEYIKKLAASGLKNIEATSFVSPKAIAQLSDAAQLFPKLLADSELQHVNLPCLVPNTIGLENAIKSGVKEIAVFTATSDEFNKKNINATIEESIERITEVLKLAHQNNIKVRGYLSCVFGCPYSGEIGVGKAIELCERLLDLGVYEVSLGDTIGVANPLQVSKYLNQISHSLPLDKIALHFHDTKGLALANILSSLDFGIRTFDASSAGLGGCPYAKGATGNVATEDVVYFFDSLGIETGVDMLKLANASAFILKQLNKVSTSKYYNAFTRTHHEHFSA